jgi:hypothetical protein
MRSSAWYGGLDVAARERESVRVDASSALRSVLQMWVVTACRVVCARECELLGRSGKGGITCAMQRSVSRVAFRAEGETKDRRRVERYETKASLLQRTDTSVYR